MTTAGLRVLVQLSDGRTTVYAWDEIPTAERLRDHLQAAGVMASDDDEFIYQPAEEWPACVHQVFRETCSWVSAMDKQAAELVAEVEA